jgi:DnaJ-class molecular chaperone
MNKKILDPERYGMVICPRCNAQGYIQDPKRQCCPKCGGFGFIMKEAEQDTNNSKYRIMSPSVKIGGI